MPSVNIYLNFMGQTEAAFNRYRDVFGGELNLQRMGDVPPDPNGPQLTEAEKNLVMHVELPIIDGTVLMGTDMLESMGHELRLGNNMTISLQYEDLAETRRVFDALSEGATEVMPLTPMFWGAHWGTFQDEFGVRWMFNCPVQPGQD